MGSEWYQKLLGDVIELKRGYDLPKKQRKVGKVPIISSAGVTDTHIEAKVKGPGVVTGRYGTIGEVFFSENDFWPLNTTLYVRDFKGNDEKFIYYFLKTIDYQQYSDKAAVPGVNRNHIHMAVVIVPSSITEQKAIAYILGTLDDKIELNRRMNATLEGMAQALFKSWFVSFDPVIDKALAAGNPIPESLHKRAEARRVLGDRRKPLPAAIQRHFPSRFVFSEEMGWVPEGWEESILGNEVETTGGGTPSTKETSFWENGANAFCTPKDMSKLESFVLLDTERYLTTTGVNNISSGQLPRGVVLMSSRAPIGYLAISDIPVSVNQGIIAMLPNDKYGAVYLFCWTHSNMGRIKSGANGSTFLEISKKNFKPIPFLVPNHEILNFFNDQVQPIYAKALLVSEEVSGLTRLRDILLQKLISGQLPIPDAEKLSKEAI